MSESFNSPLIDQGLFKPRADRSPSINQVGIKPGLVTEPRFVNVGGNGDCGFRSVAASVIDNWLSRQHLSDDTLKKILISHFTYYPKHVVSGATLEEQMNQLVAQVHMAELLESLAYTLRQICVDELCAHPTLYRGAFVDIREEGADLNKAEGTGPKMMRKRFTWIDESAIAALANALNMPIDVHGVRRIDDVPLCLEYNPCGKNPKAVIQLLDKHYTPSVVHNDYFTRVSSQLTDGVKPVVNSSLNTDPSLSQILISIKEDNERILRKFEREQNRLICMVIKDKFSKDKLLDIYIKGISHSDYLKDRGNYVDYVGTEHGSEHFMASIHAAQIGIKSVDVVPARYEDQLITALVHAIARAISIGQMSEENVYETENTSSNIRPN